MPYAIAAYVLFILAMIYGYIMNIIKIVWAVSEPIEPLFLIRCVGAVAAPLGAILGYF